MEQYDRRPLSRFSGVPETDGEIKKAKMLDVTTVAGIILKR